MSFKAKNKGKKSGGGGSHPTLDLHGYKKDDVFDAIDAFIVRHSSKSRVRIMTGKGKGHCRC